MTYAHSRGENIVLGDYGEAIMLDWGLAKQIGSADEETAPVLLTGDAQSPATRQGATPSTPAYMSPEQAADRVDLLDHRTDIYGLGTILFEVLTRYPPHRAASALPASGLAPEVPALCSFGPDRQAVANSQPVAAEHGNHPDKRGGVMALLQRIREAPRAASVRRRSHDLESTRCGVCHRDVQEAGRALPRRKSLPSRGSLESRNLS